MWHVAVAVAVCWLCIFHGARSCSAAAFPFWYLNCDSANWRSKSVFYLFILLVLLAILLQSCYGQRRVPPMNCKLRTQIVCLNGLRCQLDVCVYFAPVNRKSAQIIVAPFATGPTTPQPHLHLYLLLSERVFQFEAA